MVVDRRSSMQTTVLACGAAAVVLGLLGLAAWLIGKPILASLGPDYVPMAPLTGALFVGQGLTMLSRGFSSPSELFRGVALVVLAISILLGALGLAAYLTGLDISLDSGIASSGQRLGAIPLFQMSPLTGGLFALAGCGQLVALAWPRARQALDAGAIMGLVTVTAGFVATVGYLFDSPLLYGGSFIPLAATTSLGFIALGAGCAAACGPESAALRPLVGHSPRAVMLRAFLPLTTTIILLHGLAAKSLHGVGVSRALVSAVLAVVFTAVTAVVVLRLARRIGHTIEATQESLRESEEKFAKAFAASPALMVLSSFPEGIMLDANAAFLDFVGCRAGEVLGRGSTELGFWAEPRQRSAMVESLRTGGRVNGVDVAIRVKSGEVKTILFSAERLRINGRDCMLTVAVDVNAQRQAEAAIRVSEAKYRALFESMTDGVAVTDMTGRLIDFNESFRAMVGYPAEELLRLRYHDLTPERWREMDQQILEGHILPRGHSDVYEKQYRRKDGSLFPVELRVFLIKDDAGAPAAMWAVVRDVTERKKAEEQKKALEEQLRQAQKMEAIGVLAGGIAHDFNNILGAILGSVELAMDQAHDHGLDVPDLRQIASSVDRAKELVRQILTFSRKVAPQFKAMDLSEEVQRAIAVLKRTLPKMIDIETHLAHGLPSILADANQIGQVLLNLASNAAHAMPDGGKITIATELAVVPDGFCTGCGQPFSGEYVLLRFTDQGQGMDRETIAKIFDPFFTTKEIGQGTGLGLSTVFGTIKSHGGHVACHSEPGRGSSFIIYLPPHHGPLPAEQAAPGEESPSGGHETIMVVDDEPLLRRFARLHLETAGYEVLEAASGEDALDVLEKRAYPPHLVILDLGMPGMGGLRCAKELLARWPGLRILIASGYADDSQVRQSLDHGAINFLAKPFRRVDMLGAARRMLDRPLGRTSGAAAGFQASST